MLSIILWAVRMIAHSKGVDKEKGRGPTNTENVDKGGMREDPRCIQKRTESRG
jgi:hypothetical protein